MTFYYKNNKNKFPHANRQAGGAMLIVVIFFLFISLAIVFGLVSPQVRGSKNSNVNLNSKQSYFLAESGNEDAFYRILHNMSISDTETIMLGDKRVDTTITLAGNTKQIISLGDVSKSQRTSNLTLKTVDGAVFKYGTQAGQGGFVFHNNSYVLGSLYSNGNIVGSNGAYITGDAYVAGSSGSISNMCIGGVQGSSCTSSSTPGNAHANTVTNSNVAATIYCQTGSGNNKACDTSEADPVAQDLPISDESIEKWEADAALGGTTNGDVIISADASMGPQKIVGNLTINNNVTLTITGTVYVTGNISITGNVKLGSSYGATSGIIISDGYITINNGVVFQDSGTAGSYILLLSNSTCDASISVSPCYSHSAIEVGNTSSISIVNAQKGTVYFSNVSSVKESVGNKIELKQNVGITYGSGVFSVGFTSGPSGSWGVGSWSEVK